MEWFKKAYDNGDPAAGRDLGVCCFYGRGTQQDYVKARELLEKANGGSSEASYCLGCIYARGLGVPAYIKKGVELLQKAGDYHL